MAKLKYKDNDTWVEWSDPDKADKATTLAGYGIVDAYTKTEVDNAILAAIGGGVSLNSIIVGVMDFVHDDITITSGGLDELNRKITT